MIRQGTNPRRNHQNLHAGTIPGGLDVNSQFEAGRPVHQAGRRLSPLSAKRRLNFPSAGRPDRLAIPCNRAQKQQTKR